MTNGIVGRRLTAVLELSLLYIEPPVSFFNARLPGGLSRL
jgi:hypothetical protein